MRVTVVQYKWAGRWGPFRVKVRCGECSVSEGVIEDMLGGEFRGEPVVFEKKPWLDNWWRVIWRGGWHAPIVTVNGNVVSQGGVVDRGLLAYHVRRCLVKDYRPTGNVVFFKEGCPYCARAKKTLQETGVEYIGKDVIRDPLASLQLFHATKQFFPKNKPVTVPQIWLQGEYFGDSEAVVEAKETGLLRRYALSSPDAVAGATVARGEP